MRFEPGVDVVEAAVGVDAPQQALLRVVVDERLRALAVDREALAHRLFVVVRPLEEVVRIAVGAALARARRVRLDVEDAPAAPAGAAAREPALQHDRVDLEQHDGVQRLADLVEQAREAVGLHERARESVQDEAAPASGRASRSRMMPSMVRSSTSWPASITALAARPSSVPAATASRRRSPVDTCGTPRRASRRCACVPLPEPGAPSRTSLIFRVTPRAPARRAAPILPAASSRVKPRGSAMLRPPTGRSAPAKRI